MKTMSLESVLTISRGKLFKKSSFEAQFNHSSQIGELAFTNVSPLQYASKEQISFITDEKYLDSAKKSEAGLILCPQKFVTEITNNPSPLLVTCDYPRAAFAKISQFFYQPRHNFEGISHCSMIDDSAKIAPTATIFPYVFIGPNAIIGENTILYPGCFIGAASIVGNDCILYPNVVIREGCQIGNRCIFHPGVVVGGDGFAFEPTSNGNIKIPQVGGVEISDEVELGANATIDRGAFENTKIGLGTKLDNMVHIAHNTDLGKHCLIAAQTGIAGSTKIGNHVMMGGQVGVGDHITIADCNFIGARAGVSRNIETSDGAWFGTPARKLIKR